MSEYANGLQININEVVTLDFRENNQTNNGSVVKVIVLYDTLKHIYNALGEVIIQHDAKLAKLANDKRMTN